MLLRVGLLCGLIVLFCVRCLFTWFIACIASWFGCDCLLGDSSYGLLVKVAGYVCFTCDYAGLCWLGWLIAGYLLVYVC